MIGSTPDLANILEACLIKMESGSTIDELVNEYAGGSPEKAEELRGLLETVLAVVPEKESLRVPASAQRNSRQRFLFQAQKLQQQPGAARRQAWLRFVRFLQHHVGSVAFAVTAMALLLIALGSTQALPGDQLYPVKIAAEQAGISLSSSTAVREERESVYDTRRAEEVAEMILMKRTGRVSFGGYLGSAKDKGWQIDGIPLQIPSTMDPQVRALSGAYVEIKGFLERNGVVLVESLTPRLETVQGTISAINAGRWTIGSQAVIITTNTRISGTPHLGSPVSIQAARLAGSNQMLGISVNVANEAVTTSPTQTLTATATATVEMTSTPTATATPQPTINTKPVLNSTPEGENGSQPQPGQGTKEPEDHQNGNGSGDGGSSSDP